MLRIATRMAKKSDHEHFRHGAVVLKNGRVLATGYNKGVEHAEVNALKKVPLDKRKGCTVISVRITKTGLLSMAKPCANCAWFLKESGIKSVVWTDNQSKVNKEKVS